MNFRANAQWQVQDPIADLLALSGECRYRMVELLLQVPVYILEMALSDEDDAPTWQRFLLDTLDDALSAVEQCAPMDYAISILLPRSHTANRDLYVGTVEEVREGAGSFGNRVRCYIFKDGREYLEPDDELPRDARVIYRRIPSEAT